MAARAACNLNSMRKGRLAFVKSKIRGTVVQVNSGGDLITDISEAQLVGVGRTTDTKILVSALAILPN